MDYNMKDRNYASCREVLICTIFDLDCTRLTTPLTSQMVPAPQMSMNELPPLFLHPLNSFISTFPFRSSYDLG